MNSSRWGLLVVLVQLSVAFGCDTSHVPSGGSVGTSATNPAQPNTAASPPGTASPMSDASGGTAQPGSTQVVLSNPSMGDALRGSGLGPQFGIPGGIGSPRKAFTIDYRFQQGGPTPGVWYFLVIRTGNDSRYEADFNSLELEASGTLELSGTIHFPDRTSGQYEAYMESGTPGPFGNRQVVSNVVKF